MRPATPKSLYTVADWLAWPSSPTPVEILDGEKFVSPFPTTPHQEIAARLFAALLEHQKRRPGGKIFFAPTGVRLANDMIVIPDVLFIAEERRAIIRNAYIDGPPDFVIEILSPSNRAHDLVTKRRVYARFGIREYWIVDPDERTIETLILDGGAFVGPVLTTADRAKSQRALPEFGVEVGDIFRDLDGASGA